MTQAQSSNKKEQKWIKNMWVWMLLILLIIGALLLILKSGEPKIDIEIQKRQSELVSEAIDLEKKGFYKDAIEAYKAALGLIPSVALTKKIDSLKIIQTNADTIAWDLAQQKNTINSYQDYLKSFSDGNYLVEANEAIVAIEQFEAAQQTKKMNIEKEKASHESIIREQEAHELNRSKILAEIAANMVDVSSGTFTMGCLDYYRPPTWDDFKNGTEVRFGDCGQNENPAHEVTLSSFSISKYEVTQEQWEAVLGYNPSKFLGCDDCPVEMISWKETQQFLKKLNQQTGKHYRLPTEAEWEFAARGGNIRNEERYLYAGSDNLELVGWHYVNSDRKTHEVGQKKPNELGLYDMSGNVLEYCQDWYGIYYYANSPSRDPKGPSRGVVHVTRGGSYYSGGQSCRVTERRELSPKYNRAAFLGFRLAH